MYKNKGFDWSPYIAIAACIVFLFFIYFCQAYGADIIAAIHKYMSQHYLKFIYFFGILILVLLIIKTFKRVRENRMLDRLKMDADEKEFAKITRDLCRDKYISLKAYFKATSTFESANNFLKSCHGVAFLDAYKKESKIDNIIISKLILDVERDEQIVSCAVDILKAYSG